MFVVCLVHHEDGKPLQYTLHKANVKRPEAVAELISEEDYTRARNDELDKHHFGFVEDLFDNTKSIALLVFFVLPWFWDLVGQWSLALWSNGGEVSCDSAEA